MPINKGTLPSKLSKDIEDRRGELGSQTRVPIDQKEKRLTPPRADVDESDSDYMKRAAKSYRDRTKPDGLTSTMVLAKGMGIDAKRSDRPWEDGKVPSYKKGGKVKKTGIALLHKGEHVVPKNKVKKMDKATGKRSTKK